MAKSTDLVVHGAEIVPLSAARNSRLGIQQRPHNDCLDFLEELAEAGRRGEVIGVACVVMYRGRNYVVDAVGELRRSPTFARGAVAALDDELSRMAWGQS